MEASTFKPEKLVLSDAARNLIGEAGIRLELHCISFSHYCERARWYLRLSHVPYVETGTYVPLAHMVPLVKLGKRFKAKMPSATASSQSPAVTPTLALYDSSGAPVDLIRNSALIGRFAQLHAAAYRSCSSSSSSSTANPGTSLYSPGLTVVDGQTWGSADPGLYKKISELELRLSVVMGVEARRYVYFNVLARPQVLTQVFRNNSTGLQKTFAPLLAWLARLSLPRLLKVNKDTAARARERLLTEFDYFDQLLTEQEKAAAAAGGLGSTPTSSSHQLPFYLVGQSLTAADVSLATLAGPLMQLGGLSEKWYPELDQLPEGLQQLSKELEARPTGRFVRRMWQVHGPLAAAAAAAPL